MALLQSATAARHRIMFATSHAPSAEEIIVESSEGAVCRIR